MFRLSPRILTTQLTRHYTTTSMDVGKKAAAIKAVDKYISANQVVGIGSGSTIVFAVEHIAGMSNFQPNSPVSRTGDLKQIAIFVKYGFLASLGCH